MFRLTFEKEQNIIFDTCTKGSLDNHYFNYKRNYFTFKDKMIIILISIWEFAENKI